MKRKMPIIVKESILYLSPKIKKLRTIPTNPDKIPTHTFLLGVWKA
jgi:hypothetical protein